MAMAGTKRKIKDKSKMNADKFSKKKHKNLTNGSRESRKKVGPRLPNRLIKELDLVNHRISGSDEENSSDDEREVYKTDLYEYEEGVAEEESKKNRRFDVVENYEYELPEDFEDEDVPSDDDIDGVNAGDHNEEASSGKENDEVEEEDGRHERMLQALTGMPSEAFEGKKKKNDIVISEAYPESEYNPTSDVLDGAGRISIEDLLDPIHGKSGYSKLRKRMHQMEKKSISVQAPLRRVEQEKLERVVTYEQSKKDISKWEHLVKRNREAPTIYFDEDKDPGFSTVGAIASAFEPRTDFEKKIDALVHDDKVVEAYQKDGARLLELNKLSIKDVKDHQNRLAKMRSLLFRHEMKAKRIKKIKSKTYHRLLKKDKLKSASAELQIDPAAAKEHARKQEFKRAEERMTLKHKNSSKWAKRILKRGLSAQDEGTRSAITEQLHQHTLLTRKMNSMKEHSGSSDDSSDDDDEVSAGSERESPSKLLDKAKDKTLKVLEDDGEIPKSGVLSLPFMVRGMKKRKEAAEEEAKLALEEYESSLKKLEDAEADNQRNTMSSGRRTFGATSKQGEETTKRSKREINYGTSDSEDDFKAKDLIDDEHTKTNRLQTDVDINPDFLREESEIVQDPSFKDFDVRDLGPKTTHEVAIFASGSWKKMSNDDEVNEKAKKSLKNVKSTLQNQHPEVNDGQMRSEHEVNANTKRSLREDLQNENLPDVDEISDTDSEGDTMVDGVLSSVTGSAYELPSQAELIQRAFAGDDVEEDFEKDKQKILEEENPEPEKPVLLPGWGQWTDVQKKRGMPSWMLQEHENARMKREEALRKRKDAKFKHVIISERLDKKAEKLYTKELPFPYTSKEVFEQSIRMPIGPDYNPATAVGALNRPEVVKRPGVIIKPITYEDVNPYERTEERKHTKQEKKRKGKPATARS